MSSLLPQEHCYILVRNKKVTMMEFPFPLSYNECDDKVESSHLIT